MNKTLTISVLFFSTLLCTLKAQISYHKLQDYENKAKQYEAKGDYISAINLHYFISKNDTLEIGKNSLQRIENLLPKCTAVIMKELVGKWELKKKLDLDYYSNIKYTKFIEIKDHTILFYDTPEKVVVEINLEDNPFTYNDFGGFPSLKLDKEIWTFSTRKVSREKRLCLRKHIDKNGNIVGRIDDRGALINSINREIALRQEIDTYYIQK
ncbi:hypothetical protein [Chryseobacterium sp.]|uniref:hypothetical protein n=1 Tax=Chryseobacterium sp. TaxID=1871047 RepID=UPI002897AEBF|nr:hypothetical protein [Chryseobacterium sp.]